MISDYLPRSPMISHDLPRSPTISPAQLSDGADAKLATASSSRVVRAFIRAHCTEDRDEWLDLLTRDDHDGSVKTGFKTALDEWCS